MNIDKVFIRTENNYDRDLASDLSALDCSMARDDGCDGSLKEGAALVSLTKQSFAEEADINTIVKRFGLSGELPSDVRMPMNGDFTEVPDFRGAMDMIVAARESFQAMPWDVRSRFHNDPAEFVDFCSDPENRSEAIKLGLVEKPVDPGIAAKASADALARRVREQVEFEAAVAAARPKAP